jgi:hypothetical protein
MGAGTIMPGFPVVAMNCIAGFETAAGAAARFGAIPASALPGRPRCVSARPAIGAAIGGRTGGPAGTVAMRRFHYRQL